MRIPVVQISISVFVGLLAFFSVHLALNALNNEHLEQHQDDAKERLALIGATLSQSVNVRLNHTRSLAAFVEINPNFTQKDFDKFAAVLQKDLTGLRSLQLAPNGIVSYATNLEQNRAAIGHNLLLDPDRQHLIAKAVKEHQYVIEGPSDLIQGGIAIIARQPLYFPRQDDDQETFWGFATVLIDVEALLADAGFFELEDDLLLAIRGKDGLGAKGEVFYGDLATFEEPLSTVDIMLPSGTWQIAAALKLSHVNNGLLGPGWLWGVGGLLAFVAGLAAYIIAEQPVRLRRAVKCATADLVVAKEEAEKANRAKSEFLATMSHELRTPLTSIKGGLGLVREGVLGKIPEDAQEILDISFKNSKRLEALINDILDFQKAEVGQMVYQFEALSVSSLVENAARANEGYGATHDVKFLIKNDFPDASVKGDEGRLMQVFSNLMSNAAKFSPKGSTVELEVSRIGKMVRFSVQDQGPGIPHDFRDRAFERFSQLDSSDTRQVGGTGLGLNIAKTIVEEHGGVIDFVSEINIGTTFYFDLPEIEKVITA